MTLFPCLIKYYHIMFINIVPPLGQWMDYRCRLVRKFIHCFGGSLPRGKIGLSYCLGIWDFIFSCPLFFLPCSRISSYLLPFLCRISFLLFPCAGVWEITRAYWMMLHFFRQCNYKCTKENSVRDGGTSPSNSNLLPTKLNWPYVVTSIVWPQLLIIK